MSAWPLISDFAKMLQNPQHGFRAPDFKTCTVEMNQLGQPKARSGNFATVYRGYRADGTEFAIRIFNRRQDERLEHYRTVADYLERRSLSSIVKFEYDERGIRSASDGKLYPLLTMEWVPGITLFEWIRDRCREGYAEALKIASEVWLHVVRELAQNYIVHGDLQHGNVMVSPEGHFRLVDYDCMCVPALIGRRNLEIGMTPYQHPGRNPDTQLFPGLDNFSSLVIYVALRALAAAPHLWLAYVDQTSYDKILFRMQDFENPRASPLYHELLRSPDEQVRDLSHYLFELVKYDLHDIPPVDEVLLWCQSVESLISARDWDKVVDFVERVGESQVTSELQPFIQEGRNRVACRKAAEAALQQGDEERLEQLYATGLLHDYPAAAQLLEPASRAADVRQVLRLLASAKQFQAWDKLKSTWLTYQHLLTGRVSAKPYEQEVQKLLSIDRLRELLAAPPTADERPLQEAWEYLEQLGGHPWAEPYREQIQQRLARRDGLLKLQELLLHKPRVATLDFDRKVLAAIPASAIQGLDPASPLIKEYQAAAKRLQCVRKVREAEKAGTVEAETFIAEVMQQLPNSYHEGLARRSQQARQRLYVFGEFTRTLQEPCLEAVIVQAWKRLAQVRGQSLASQEQRQRADLAEARTPLVQALMLIPEDASEAEKQQQVLAVWNDALLKNCHEAAPWREIYQRFQGARTVGQQLSQALEAGNLTEVARLLALPEAQSADLPRDVAQTVEAARAAVQQAGAAKRQALINALRDSQRKDFAELFDFALLADICRQSRHHQPLICQWMETEILPHARCGLAADPETAIRRDEASNLTLVWTWPKPQISRVCRVVVTRQRPRAQASPDDLAVEHSATLSADHWDPATGYQVAMAPEWEDCAVFVWAVIDLGFQVFYSPPLELGQIPALAKQPAQRRWGLFRGWMGGDKKGKEEDEEGKPAAPADAAANSDLPPPPADESPAAGQADKKK